MAYKFNPLLGVGLDEVGAGGGASVAGSDTEIQYNDGGSLGASVDLTWDDTGKVLGVGGDIALSGRFISSLNGAASAPPGTFTGTWFTGGTATTTKPQVLIEPTGATSTTWSTSGTGLGVNAASGFAGRLLDLHINGVSVFYVNYSGYMVGSAGNFGSSVLDNTGLTLINNRSVTFTGSLVGTVNWGDLFIARDAAGILAQRNGTNAQTFRVYGTFTDASNHVRASLSSSSTAVTLAAETAGTGADDIPLNLTAAGTGAVKVNSNLEIADTKNIALATGTGTKIGTATAQKLGFWDKTPVVQPTTGISGATFVANSGGSIHPSSTFDGYTIAQVVAALRQIGILA